MDVVPVSADSGIHESGGSPSTPWSSVKRRRSPVGSQASTSATRTGNGSPKHLLSPIRSPWLSPVPQKLHPNRKCDCPPCAALNWRRPDTGPELGTMGKHLICFIHNRGGCVEPGKCSRLHVCCNWVLGKCSADNCSLGHSIGSGRNKELLVNRGFSNIDDNTLPTLCLRSASEASIFSDFVKSVERFRKKRCVAGVVDVDHVEQGNSQSQENPQLRETLPLLSYIALVKATEREFPHTVEQLSALFLLRIAWIQEAAAAGNEFADEHGLSNKENSVFSWSTEMEDGTKELIECSLAGVSFGLYTSVRVLEQAYKKRELRHLTLRIGTDVYKYTFSSDGLSLHQVDIYNGITRKVERKSVDRERDLPAHWLPMIQVHDEGTRAVLAPLSRGNEESKMIRELFESDGSFFGSKILQIYRIQNPFLYKHYELRKQELAFMYRNAGANISELLLFYGSNSDTVKLICQENFDWRRNGDELGRAAYYGNGVHFTSKASNAHDATVKNEDGTRFVFVAFVLVGLKCAGDADMLYPPIWKEEIHFDTAVDVVSSPEIFVKFQSHEFYPAYLVQYSTSFNE